ncbi:MAG TPA: hypothetical protein VKE74_34465 [Gemmataceae bacterium]|nr:hypothetical protein [Gemmataceae bacterium]
MRRYLLGVVASLALAPAAPAAVFVVGNFTDHDVTFTVAEPQHKSQTVKVPTFQVIPVTVAGPCDLTFAAKGGNKTFRIDVYNAYAFIPDPAGGVRLEGIDLPGEAPERDSKPETNPAPREVLKIPVTLLLDDADPRADQNWQPDLRERFTEAAAIIEAACGVRFEFDGYGRWSVDPKAKDMDGLLANFEAEVKVKPGRLAIGWTARRVEEKQDAPAPFGACRGIPCGHVLIREGRLVDKGERTEVLTHYLAIALGAVPIPDPGSVMRPTLGDGKARLTGFTLRLDPLNELAMNIWADELRRGPIESAGEASGVNRIRLSRVYKALLKASPGNSLALGYLNDFDRDPPPRPKK